jgi:polyphosphate kinase
MVRDPQRKEQRFARIKVPPVLPRFIPLIEGERYVPLEDVIALHVPSLFPGMDIVAHHPFRVTRDGDLDDVDSDAEDLLAAIQTELRRRRRHARLVRLEVDPRMSPEVLELLTRELELQPVDVYHIDGLLDMGSLSALASIDRPDLKEEPWTPTTQPRLRGMGLTCSRNCARAMCSPTTRTTHLPPQSKPSSITLRPTPTCWPSSRPSIEPRDPRVRLFDP